MSSEIVSVIADIALTLSLIVAIVFGIAQVRTAKVDRRERLTLGALRNFQSKEFAEMILLTMVDKFPQNYQQWLEWPKAERVLFIQLIQEMESLGILLGDGLIDIDLLDKTLGSFIVTTWEKLKPALTAMREKNNDPYLSEYFQWMAEQIDRRMKEKPRKPFFQSAGPIV